MSEEKELRSTVLKRLQHTDDAFEKGREAAASGKDRDSNPFGVTQTEFHQWRNGYDKATRQRSKEA